MDPLTQGTVGAAFSQSSADKKNILKISVIGFLAGLAPDLDVLIQSSTDPILFLEYHRQFLSLTFFKKPYPLWIFNCCSNYFPFI